MSATVYRNAVLLLNGTDLSGALHDFGVEYAAEMLDVTTMGQDTRVKKGGLKTAKMSGKAFFDASVGVEVILFPDVGVDDVILTVFPDGVTEGATGAGAGYAMKGVLSTFNMGGAVGQPLDVTFAAESRGILTPGVTSTP